MVMVVRKGAERVTGFYGVRIGSAGARGSDKRARGDQSDDAKSWPARTRLSCSNCGPRTCLANCQIGSPAIFGFMMSPNNSLPCASTSWKRNGSMPRSEDDIVIETEQHSVARKYGQGLRERGVSRLFSLVNDEDAF